MPELILTATGIRPLLTHNPASMSRPKAAGRKGKEQYIPEEEAEDGVYRLEDGSCALPGIAFRNSILSAAGAWKAGRGKSSMKSILSHIEVKEELVRLTLDGKPIEDYTIDKRRAVIQRQGIIRCRPRFDEWQATFTVLYDEQLVPEPEIIVEIANDAGQRIGVGDYRPAKGGWFGRFKVELLRNTSVKKGKKAA